MKLCTLHDTALRDTLDARGLGALIVDDPELAKKHLADAIQCGPNVDNFEPYAFAWNAIVNNAIVTLADPTSTARLMSDRDACPLCFLFERAGKRFDHWITEAADEIVIEWRKLGSAT